MQVEESSGIAFMIYRTNNQHAESRTYHLYDDLMATYYLTEAGELVCACNSMKDMMAVEFDVQTSDLMAFLTPKGNFQFEEPVLNFMIQGDFYSFEDFLSFIREDG